jgi:hypothetical protein
MRPVPFWIDSLGVPLWKKGRQKALKSMEWIYKAAPAIFVLDNGLLNISTAQTSRKMEPEEIALRIMCSDWARRLWTLQEGSFQERVRYTWQRRKLDHYRNATMNAYHNKRQCDKTKCKHYVDHELPKTSISIGRFQLLLNCAKRQISFKASG